MSPPPARRAGRRPAGSAGETAAPPAGTGTEPAGPDGRHIVVDGRRWRATDPGIPAPLRTELVRELMAARRAVGAGGAEAAVAAARRRVQDAKVALGERGSPWWERTNGQVSPVRVGAAARTLLRQRAADATICPSEIARVVASPDWREAMAAVRAVALDLAAEGALEVRQRGRPVPDPTTARGALRYGRGPAFPDPPPAGSDASVTTARPPADRPPADRGQR